MVKKVVWKYGIPIEDNFNIDMPYGAKMLYFGLQYDKPRLWVLVNPSERMIKRRFRLAGTGHDINEEGLIYIGTVKMMDETLIFHLFEH